MTAPKHGQAKFARWSRWRLSGCWAWPGPAKNVSASGNRRGAWPRRGGCDWRGAHAFIRCPRYFGVMKKLLLLSAYLLALGFSPVIAQTGGPAVAVVQLTYGSTNFGGGTIEIVVSRGTGPVEKIEVKGYLKDDSLEPNALQQVLAKLYAEGYSLKGTNGGGYRPTVYILSKGQ